MVLDLELLVSTTLPSHSLLLTPTPLPGDPFSPQAPYPLRQNFLGVLGLHGTVQKSLILFNASISHEKTEAHGR